MRRTLFFLAITAISLILQPAHAGVRAPKEWTFLIFLNGHNNLDSYGAFNINQMEKTGSTDRINVVVQWASIKNKTVKRLLVQKDNDTGKVTSPVIQDMGRVDMGDWHQLVEFVRWGKDNFPAQKYFVDIWNHGSGWHGRNGVIDSGISPMDISYDDLSGNHMTTQQMGFALNESAKILGQKIDLYGSDACLMAMIEIAHEVKDAVRVFAGSEELEPGEGWPYDTLLARWNATPNATPQAVAKILSEEYARYYEKSRNNVTFSAFDLQNLPQLNATIRKFGESLKALGANALGQVRQAAAKSQKFTNSDYVDFIDFMNNLKTAQVASLNTSLLSEVNTATRSVIIANNTVRYPRANGMAIWLPSTSYEYSRYADLYSRLTFDRDTRWGDFLKAMVK
jgi:hypothetical protein